MKRISGKFLHFSVKKDGNLNQMKRVSCLTVFHILGSVCEVRESVSTITVDKLCCTKLSHVVESQSRESYTVYDCIEKF